MKKSVFLLFILTTLLACKETPKKESKKLLGDKNNVEVTNTKTYRGEYIHTDEGAVLYGKDFIFGVVLNDKEQELAKKVAPVKKEDLDMIPVVVQGYVNKKKPGEEGWEDILTITEIVLVGTEPTNPDIKVDTNAESN